MNKLKLRLESLAVETFETTRLEREKGTVVGEELCTCHTACGQNTCPGCPTCEATCAATCDDYTCPNSCGGSCGGWSCYPPCIDIQG